MKTTNRIDNKYTAPEKNKVSNVNAIKNPKKIEMPNNKNTVVLLGITIFFNE